MLRKVLLLSISLTISTFSIKAVKMSVACKQTLDTINEDSTKLYYFFVGAFNGMAKENNPHYKPSAIITFFASSKESDLNQKVPLVHMSATDYLINFVQPRLPNLDQAFYEKYNETKKVPETWQWFTEHFKEKGLKEPLEIYAQQLIENDQCRLKSQGLLPLNEKK